MSDPTIARRKLAQIQRLFAQGRIVEAEELSEQAVLTNMLPKEATPLASIWTTRACHLMTMGNHRLAFEKLYTVLGHFPEYGLAKYLFIDLIKEQLSARPTHGYWGGRFVFGLGSGRSGSTSLARLLGMQKGTYASHEHRPAIGWYSDPYGGCDHNLQRMKLLARAYEVVADVSHWWLNQVDNILEQFPSSRFVILIRDKAETVESFVKIKGGDRPGALNHWIDHDGRYWQKTNWDFTYPNFQEVSLCKSVERYWDLYYNVARATVDKHPIQARLFEMEQLSTVNGQQEILSFCGFDSPVLLPDARLNAGSTDDGSDIPPYPFP